MKITDVKIAVVGGNFEWILVRVYTDEGLVGLGECYWGAGVAAAVSRLAPLLLDEDPHNVDWLYQKMIRGMSGAGSTGGTVVAAISGVELALWDIKGKALGTPIYNLLGGRYRSKIRLYADCGHGKQPTPESWAQRAREAIERGFTAIKFDVDNTDPTRFGDPHHVSSRGGGWSARSVEPSRTQKRPGQMPGALRNVPDQPMAVLVLAATTRHGEADEAQTEERNRRRLRNDGERRTYAVAQTEEVESLRARSRPRNDDHTRCVGVQGDD